MITVDNLKKDFEIKRKTGGLFSRARVEAFSAVKGISFDIAAGERVAFIGPNGAGKSTTLKMLSGILSPTDGHATVAGFVPWQARRALSVHIGLVFGQRSQLWYYLPVRQSLDLLGKIYGLSADDYARQLSVLSHMFHLEPLLDQPVRSLSLGQRMRCEIAASLVHSPRVLFLDEPTIGLDVTAKAELRDHLRQLGQENGMTIILTSHDTDDIEKICDRVILINHGEKLIDTSLSAMRRRYLSQKQLSFVTAEEKPAVLIAGVLSSRTEPHKLVLDIDPSVTPVAAVISAVLAAVEVHDVTVSDQPLEDVIKSIYAGKSI